MRHCLVMADKVAKLPSLVNNLITNQGVTLFIYSKPLHAFRNIGLIGFEEEE